MTDIKQLQELIDKSGCTPLLCTCALDQTGHDFQAAAWKLIEWEMSRILKLPIGDRRMPAKLLKLLDEVTS